jgi:hypothetical protein
MRSGWLARELVLATTRTALLGLAGASAMVAAARARSTRARSLATAALPVVVAADLIGAHWHDAPTISPTYWTSPPASARLIRSDPSFVRLFGVAARSAGEPGYASTPVDFFAVRDTLDWSLPPLWGLDSSGGQTPIIARRFLDYTEHTGIGRGRFDIESVTHVVTGAGLNVSAFGPGQLAGTARVYRNENALPRARLAGRPAYADDQRQAMSALDRLGPELRDRLVVEDPDRPLAPDAVADGSARVTVDEPERVEVETDSKGPAYLVLSDTFDPGWSATVDGRDRPIRPAYVAFRAVFAPEGRHRVVFRYRPAGFLPGLAVSLSGALAALLLIAWPRRLPALRDAHAALDWPARWPVYALAACAVLIAVSSVKWAGDGKLRVHPRWSESFHQFTWGAGIEAMRPPPKR